jgi:hypothetical protein
METADTPSSTTNKLSNDIVRGAEELSEFVFGNRDRENVRRIYYLAERTKIPIFRLGSTLSCESRPSDTGLPTRNYDQATRRVSSPPPRAAPTHPSIPISKRRTLPRQAWVPTHSDFCAVLCQFCAVEFLGAVWNPRLNDANLLGSNGFSSHCLRAVRNA